MESAAAEGRVEGDRIDCRLINDWIQDTGLLGPNNSTVITMSTVYVL